MSKSANKTMNSKTVATIVLAVLAVLTLAFTVFGITGTPKEGNLYYYRSWIPGSFKAWPEALKSASDIGATKTLTLELTAQEGSQIDAEAVKTVLSKRLSMLGVYDGKVTVDGTTATITYPASSADANGDVVGESMLYTGNVQITWGGQNVITNDGIASVKTYGSQNGYVLEVRFNKEGKAALKAIADTIENDNLEILLDGASVTGSNFSSEGKDFIDKGLFLYMNNSATARLQSMLYAAGLGCGDMKAGVSMTSLEESEPANGLVPTLIIVIAAVACFAAMFILAKRGAVAGVWGLVLYVAVFFFCVAELLNNSGYVNLIFVILTALTFGLITYNFISCMNAIRKEEASRSAKAAISFGFKADMRKFYSVNGIVFLVGFILGFIPAVKMYGFLLMIAVVLNIVINRLFVRLVLHLMNSASSK